MPNQRLWTYRGNRPSAASGADRLLAKVTLHGALPQRPVRFTLAELVLDTDLSPVEAMTALHELTDKGLITVFPTPRLTHIGQPTTYTVWLLPLPS